MELYNEQLLNRFIKTRKIFIIFFVILTTLIVSLITLGLILINRKNYQTLLILLMIIPTILVLVDIFLLTYGIIDKSKNIMHIKSALNSNEDYLVGKIVSIKNNHILLPFSFMAKEVEFDNGVMVKSYFLLDIFDPSVLPINQPIKIKVHTSSIIEVVNHE